MAEVISYFVILLFVFCSSVIFGTVHSKGVQYGPSISSLTSSKSEERKAGSVPRKIHQVLLEDFPNYSVVIPLLSGKPHGLSAEIMMDRGTVKTGQFVVQAPKGYGVMAVIQELDLPVETIDYVGLFGLNIKKKCTDFVQFKDSRNVKTKAICGKVGRDSHEAAANGLTGPRSFNSSNGKIVVSFQQGDISDLSLFNSAAYFQNLKNNEAGVDLGYLYKLEIVFTAYSSCEAQSKNTDSTLAPCESSDKQDNDTCINANLFCDNYINCGIPSEFAFDEVNCSSQNSSILQGLKSGELSSTPEINNVSTFDTISSLFSHLWSPLQPKEKIETQPMPASQFYPEQKYEVLNHQRDSEGSVYLRNENAMFDNVDLHITPTGIILLIILTIATVMILSVIVRFCCYRCVGKNPENSPTHPANASINYGSTNIQTDSPTRSQSRGIRNGQSSLVSYIDTPPTYEELFPTFLYKSGGNANLSSSSSPISIVPQNDDIQNEGRRNPIENTNNKTDDR